MTWRRALSVTARAEDGVIEGVEGSADEGWLLAVQWHPEEFHQDRILRTSGYFRPW